MSFFGLLISKRRIKNTFLGVLELINLSPATNTVSRRQGALSTYVKMNINPGWTHYYTYYHLSVSFYLISYFYTHAFLLRELWITFWVAKSSLGPKHHIQHLMEKPVLATIAPGSWEPRELL